MIELTGMAGDGSHDVLHLLDEENMGIEMPVNFADQQEIGKLVTMIVSLNRDASTEEIERLFREHVDQYGSYVAANTALECQEGCKVEKITPN